MAEHAHEPTAPPSGATWIRVCATTDIPAGAGRRVLVAERRLAVFRTAHGAVLAVDDRCPHRGGPLSEGLVSDHVVTCPLHGWRVDLVTGSAIAPDRGCVRRYPAMVRDGGVWVAADAGDPQPRSWADTNGVHPDSGRARLGPRRAVAADFTLHELDRPRPVLAVEPPADIRADELRLTIAAPGRAPVELGIADLRDRFQVVTAPAHITCLMFGFAIPVTWTGVRLADVLQALDLPPWSFATFYAWDTTATGEGSRYFEPLPRAYALDPRTLLAFGLDGEPLPREHGGPLRLAVPFLQGYKSVKWLTTIAVGDQDTVGYKRRGGFIVMPELAPLPEENP
jgi:nitrite reductase (NADH) small subunit